MPNPIVHWEISGKDGAKLQDFYGKMFDWKINSDNPMNYGIVETGGTGGINGGIFGSKEGAPSYVTFYVMVDDLQAYLDKAVGLGGKAILPPMPIEGVGATLCECSCSPECSLSLVRISGARALALAADASTPVTPTGSTPNPSAGCSSQRG